MASSTSPQSQAPRPRRALEPVLAHIRAHLSEPLRLEELAALCGLSLWRFATVFREDLGVSPYRYINQLRVQHAQALLRQGMPAARAASESGFYDQSHLSRRFKRLCGMTPGQYQSAGAPAPLSPALSSSSSSPSLL